MDIQSTAGDSDPLLSIHSRIRHLEAAKEDHLSKISEIDANIVRYRSEINRMASISSFPAEILAMIFSAGQDSSTSHWHCQCCPPFEVLVSHVTSHWRAVAISIPKLWRTIRVVLPNPSNWVPQYLLRSREALVDVHLVLDGSITSSEVEDHFRILDKHVGRIRRFSIRSEGHEDIFPLVRCLSNTPAPFLQDFQIYANFDAVYVRPIAQRIFADDAPSLTTAYLYNIGLHCCLFPRNSLTALHIGELLYNMWTTYDCLFDMFSPLTSLKHLEVLGELLDDWPAVIPAKAIHLPSLTSLRISTVVYDEEHISGLLMVLDAPLLAELVLETMLDTEFEPFFQNTETLGPKYPLLRSLTLHRVDQCSTSTETICNLARSFPTVTALAVITSSEEQLEAFRLPLQVTESPAGIIHWPALEVFSLDIQAPQNSAAVLKEIVMARKHNGRAIRELHLTKQIMLQGEENGEMKWLREHSEIHEYVSEVKSSGYIVQWEDWE